MNARQIQLCRFYAQAIFNDAFTKVQLSTGAIGRMTEEEKNNVRQTTECLIEDQFYDVSETDERFTDEERKVIRQEINSLLEGS